MKKIYIKKINVKNFEKISLSCFYDQAFYESFKNHLKITYKLLKIL